MMNEWYKNSVLWGLLIIAGGIALLVQNLLNFPLGGIFWGVVFMVVGFAIFRLAWNSDRPWWPFIPGLTLMGMGLTGLLGVVLPKVETYIGGALVLGSLGASFVLVYLRERRNWWAIIPAGVMFTLAATSLIEQGHFGLDSGGIFFIGLGLTFLTLAWLPGQQLRWAFIPALALIVMGALAGFFAGASSSLVWAVVLIAAGGMMALRSFRKGY